MRKIFSTGKEIVFVLFVIYSYFKNRKDLEYIWRLRKLFITDEDGRSCVSHRLCQFPWIFVKIYCGYYCCWFSCKYDTKNMSKIKHYKIDKWGEFLREIVSINDDTLNHMKESYISKKFRHKHYCYKENGVKCLISECGH